MKPLQSTALLAAGLAASCSQSSATAPVRALSTSGDVAFVCLEVESESGPARGRARGDCPGFTASNEAPRRLHALLTQPETGEVAVIDLGSSPAQPVDFDPSQPGFNFLPVGANPQAIASTPGGVASFVATAEVGRAGLFALPSSCVYPESGVTRDLTAWPACSLPVAPAALEVLIDPPERSTDGSLSNRLRRSCAEPYVEALEPSPGALRDECPADLGEETELPGRRKLAVALPGLSEIWVIDAQEVLDRQPGSFDACQPEARLQLTAPAEPGEVRLPPELQAPAECLPQPSAAPPPVSATALPVDFAVALDAALTNHRVLYVADRGASVVHRVDVQDPCAPTEQPPLRTSSYSEPGTPIPTRRVAVSPLTPGGQRFVYAVDDSQTQTSGSVMAFDVSPGAESTAPLVPDRALQNPGRIPDRLVFGEAVADVEFVYQDLPTEDPDPDLGGRVEGVQCDPTPSASVQNSAGAAYRDTAGPGRLRGTFAFVALVDGQIAVVDVEDLDAPCRRPLTSGGDSNAENLLGCADGPDAPTAFETSEGAATVSSELSCQVVQPHRERSSTLFNRVGSSSPTLTLGTGRSVVTDQSASGRDYPKLIAARWPIETPAATGGQQDANFIELDPSRAEDNSVLLSYVEPRNQASQTSVLTYEGQYASLFDTRLGQDQQGRLEIRANVNARLCSTGVRDSAAILERGLALGLTEADQTAFAARHTDFVQWRGALLEFDDPYWARGNPGFTCGADLFDGAAGRASCDQYFGPATAPGAARELRIVEAYQDRLVVEPRSLSEPSAERQALVDDFMRCCFPNSGSLQLRAGAHWILLGLQAGLAQVNHPIIAAPNGRCEVSCNPLASELRSRVFEISCAGSCEAGDAAGAPGPPVTGEDFVCSVASVLDGIDPDEPGAACVFQDLTHRFAVYRGQEPSARGMRFQWSESGGFIPFRSNLTQVSDRARSGPSRISFVPELHLLFVPDGSARGLAQVSPRSLRASVLF